MNLLRTDYRGIGPWRAIADALNAIGQVINNIKPGAGIDVYDSGNHLNIENTRTGGSGGGPGFPWGKVSFGYRIATVTPEGDDPTYVAAMINPGSVRMHGLRVYVLADETEAVLVSNSCYVCLLIDRTAEDNDISLEVTTVLTPSTSRHLRIPLYRFDKTGSTYAIGYIYHFGDVNIDQPIR
jgi:hypothetical protein